MPIQVDHSPSYIQYGQAIQESEKKKEGYRRFTDMANYMRSLKDLELEERRIDEQELYKLYDAAVAAQQITNQAFNTGLAFSEAGGGHSGGGSAEMSALMGAGQVRKRSDAYNQSAALSSYLTNLLKSRTSGSLPK